MYLRYYHLDVSSTLEKLLQRDFTFFLCVCARSPKSGVCSALTAHLNSYQPRSKCSLVPWPLAAIWDSMLLSPHFKCLHV